MKTYIGTRTSEGLAVMVRDGDRLYELPPRHDLRNHSPTGFECGYNGSGPAQLALAVCADLTDDDTAQRFYQRVKEKVVSGLPRDRGWTLTAAEVYAAFGVPLNIG